jgi:hypothetical protein
MPCPISDHGSGDDAQANFFLLVVRDLTARAGQRLEGPHQLLAQFGDGLGRVGADLDPHRRVDINPDAVFFAFLAGREKFVEIRLNMSVNPVRGVERVEAPTSSILSASALDFCPDDGSVGGNVYGPAGAPKGPDGAPPGGKLKVTRYAVGGYVQEKRSIWIWQFVAASRFAIH